MGDPSETELRAIRASAGALLEWERDALGGQAIAWQPVEKAQAAVQSADTAPPAQTPDPLSRQDDVQRHLAVLAKEAAACDRCELHAGRTKSVFSRGTAAADLVFVGEGPGYHEDQQGLPFVGRAGQLLDKMITAMGYDREQVYVCNVVKCRPPDNRTPLPTEAEACSRFLISQIQAVQPKVIVALGKCAADNLGCVPPAGRWRGQWGRWQGIDVMPTYHPAFLLRSPEFKKPVWQDLKDVLRRLGRTAGERA